MEMKSMTAYAYVCKRRDAQVLQIALRSMNYKYLDIHIHNLPPEKVFLEEQIKKEIRKEIPRGKIEVFVALKGHVQVAVRIDEHALANYIEQIKKVEKKFGIKSQLNMTELLKLPQVVWWEEKKGKEEDWVVAATREAVDKLLAFKKKEGKIIRAEMLKNAKKLKANAGKINQLKPVIKAEGALKEDIDEEISLMTFYIDKLIKNIGAKNDLSQGKGIDFLTQEIMRELNAASSKTRNQILGEMLVESKNYLDRIREQAQNIE
jgi:uncharacterized protein YicC (UPF0701 family)